MYKRQLLCVAVLAKAVASDTLKLAPLYAADSPTAVDGEYVVILKEELSDNDVRGHMAAVCQLFSNRGNHSEVMSEYHIGSFRGYGARMNDKMLAVVRSISHVKYVECAQVYKTLADCDLQAGATWGLVRTTERDWPPQDYDYSYEKGKHYKRLNE